MGDGLLLKFPSVVDAVECAIAIQRLMAERNAETSESNRIVYRVGLHLGDVLIDGNDILGEGSISRLGLGYFANPAASSFPAQRMSMCAGGSKPASSISARRSWKNIALPVRAYRVALDG